MKNQIQKICSMAIVGLLMFSGCIDTEEAIGTNINPTAVVDVVTGLRVVNLNDQFPYHRFLIYYFNRLRDLTPLLALNRRSDSS